MKISHGVAKLAECFARNPWRVLGAALLLSIVAACAAAQLPVYTSRQALLPQNTEVATRFNDFLKNFGAASDLIVVLEGAPRSELEIFANALAAKLRTEPEIGEAISRLDMVFFLHHAYLLMPSADLDKLAVLAKQPVLGGGMEESLRKALSWSKEPLAFNGVDTDLQSAEANLKTAEFFLAEWQRWLSAETTPASVDWSRLLAENGVGSMADGYFASRDGRMLFLFVHPKNPSGDFETLAPFISKVKQVSAALAEQTKSAGRVAPTIGLTGLPAVEYEEYVNIRNDIVLVIGSSAVLIAALILLVVRSVRWAVLIFVPMGLGVLWSLGLALVTVGHLTIITAAFIAILFGLGADYGIFTAARIAEERRAGMPLPEAIGAGIGASFVALLTAGGASLLIFGALATVDFPGFAELGLVAAKGVLLILLSTWTVQPALYALLPPRLRDIPSPSALPVSAASENRRGAFPTPLALAIVMLALGGAVFGAVKGRAIQFDYDVLAMLPGDSQAAYYQRRMVAESDYQAEVVILTAPDMAEARRIAAETGKLESIAGVQSLAVLFPEDNGARLSKAASIGASLVRSGAAMQVAELERAGLSPKAFELLQGLLANATGLIDDAQERAFAAGHVQLVERLENVREQLAVIAVTLAADGEAGRLRSERLLRALLAGARAGLDVVASWREAEPLTPEQLPPALRNRFFGADGRTAIYAFPAKSVYVPENLDALINDVYGVSPNVTGFPTTHQAFSKAVVESFSRGTRLALALCLLWVMAATRSVRGFILAVLPLLIGGGWMLGLMAMAGVRYNYANIVALPLVIALAVDYGVWFSYRWRELKGRTPFYISRAAGKVIGLAAGTELAGLGGITLAGYRGVSSLGVSITLGLVCCLTATLVVAPAIGQLLDFKRQP
ncbi:MAG: sterol transporter cytoplasmic membrane protein BstA [Gammaproteobacteria bacterium]